MSRHRATRLAGRAGVRVSLFGSVLLGPTLLGLTLLGPVSLGFLETPLHAQVPDEALSTSVRPGQEPTIPDGSDIDGSTMVVSLVTMGPGRRVWERFGHNAIWVRDPIRGINRMYNYGMFSFQQENFLKRFIQGEMMYWMAGFDGRLHMGAYIEADRSVWVQELNLTPDKRAEMYAFVEWNERPENRFYPYDYYRDNCSTRVRDALDRVLDGRLRDLTFDAETGTTYRFHTRRLLAPDLGAYAGTLFSLGQPIDQPISAWEEMFLPVRMMKTLRGVTVLDPDGQEVPLVRSEDTIYLSSMPVERETPPAWLLGFLGFGLIVAAGILPLGSRGSTPRASRIAAASLTSLWGLLVGVGGWFLVLVWIFTQHWAAHWNENILLFNPLAIALVALVPLAVAGRGGAGVGRWARRLVWIVAATSVLALVIQLLPAFDQVNSEIIAAVLPPNLAMAWAVSRLTA